MATATRHLQEATMPFGKGARVNRERGIIFGPKLLGWKSGHGYEYSPTGVDPKLYEGTRCCVGHSKPGASRPPSDTIGYFEGAHKRKDGVYADRLVLLDPRGSFEQRLLHAAEKNPGIFALSHSASAGKWSSDGRVVESVASVTSVDIVERGASNSGLFEGLNVPRGGRLVKICGAIEIMKHRRPRYAAKLRQAVRLGILREQDDMDDPTMLDQAPGGDHAQAIRDAAKACIDDTSLTPEEQITKIRKLLQLIGTAETEKPAAPEEYDDGGAAAAVASGVMDPQEGMVPADRSRWKSWLNDTRAPAGPGRGAAVQEARRERVQVPKGLSKAELAAWLRG